MFDSHFWRDAGERALATFAQALIAAISVDFAIYSGEQWRAALATALLAALLSVLKAMAATRIGDPTSAAALRVAPGDEYGGYEELPEGEDVPPVDDDDVPMSED